MSANSTKRSIIRYLVFPELKPRFQELFASGFRFIPYFIALVYQCVRILPAGHPYLDPANIGRFGLRHVVAEAANHINVKRANIDQLVVFGLILLGIGLLAMQLASMVFGVVLQPALAFAAPSLNDFFVTKEPLQDLALMLMDAVFGLPSDVFGSCVSTASEPCLNLHSGEEVMILPDYPTPAHVGLHQMFRVYSTGLLVVAVFITMYFIATIIAETAQTGTPMGKRFNKVWAPIRIVLAFGLLVPVTHGLNSAQWIVLYAAKMGSGFATNGWVLFNDTLSERYTDGVENMLVATPKIPEVGVLLQFMYTARTCYEIHKSQNPEAYANTLTKSGTGTANPDQRGQVAPYLVGDVLATPNYMLVKNLGFGAAGYDGNNQAHISKVKAALPYEDMIRFLNGKNEVTLRFGVRDPEAYPAERGNVRPTCGELKFTLEDPNLPESATGTGSNQVHAQRGPELLQRYYWFVIKELWFSNAVFDWDENYPLHYINSDAVPAPPAEMRTSLQNFYSRDLHGVLTGDNASAQILFNSEGAVIEQMESERWNVDDALTKRGWGGASIWYNKIAEMNGPLTGAIFNVPLPSLYPAVMEYVQRKRRQYDEDVPMDQRFNPELAASIAMPFENENDRRNAERLNEAFQYWMVGGFASSTHTSSTGNAIIDLINAMLGTDGLFSMRDNENLHPLAQIVGVGKSLVDSSIRNLGYAAIGGAAGLLAGALGIDGGAGVIGVITGFIITITMIGLTAGFILFYIVPFLPFIYFFFALGGWVKGIFEAMVGAPLWALAHIRIDGDGLTGKAAAAGYYLIFEIFIRPIMVIFGFLASITIFAATVAVLNNIFDLVVQNVAGYDVSAAENASFTDIEFYRAPIDEFFYTVVYAILVYLLGMASFKLIDQIPNNILRWMGQSTATFNDSRENPAEKMVGTATVGTQQILQKMGKGLEDMNKAVTGLATETQQSQKRAADQARAEREARRNAGSNTGGGEPPAGGGN